MRLTKNFTLREFRCGCGCGIEREYVDELRETAELCQRVRDAIAWPLIVRTGIRCEKYNRQCGGAKRSQHLPSQGARAADLVLSEGAGKPTIREFWRVIRPRVDELGIRGIGYYKRKDGDRRPHFLHVDHRNGRFAQWGSNRPDWKT